MFWPSCRKSGMKNSAANSPVINTEINSSETTNGQHRKIRTSSSGCSTSSSITTNSASSSANRPVATAKKPGRSNLRRTAPGMVGTAANARMVPSTPIGTLM